MAYQSHHQYQQEYDDDYSYNPYNSQRNYSPPRSTGGYQVAPMSSYPPPLPSPPPHARYNDAGHTLPSLPPTNPYYQHQTHQHQNPPVTNPANYGRAPSPTRPQYREEQGQIKTSAYRQHRMAAAVDTNTSGYFPQAQNRVVQNPPSPKKEASVVAQTQVQPFNMPRSPNEVPPVPSNTLLDYGQSPDHGYDAGHYQSDQYAPDRPPHGMASLAASATAALTRAPRMSMQPTLPMLTIPSSTNPRAPSLYHDDNRHLSPSEHTPNLYSHANSSRTGLIPAAAPQGLAPIALARHNSNGSYISRSRSPVRSEYQFSEYAPSLEAPNRTTGLGVIDPMEIADDENDDPFVTLNSKRGYQSATKASAASGAGVGFLMSKEARDGSGTYGQLPGSSAGSKMGGGGDGNGGKSAWVQLSEKKARTRRKRMLWAFGILAVVAILGVTGAILGPVLKKTLSNSSSDNDTTNSTPTTNNPSNYLTASSSEIKALLNNANLHKVFPGMDYTPQNSQYPSCLSSPPSQNNITKDIAVLSQLTPLIRLYGTDCNVTDMVLTSLSLLNLDSKDVKVMTGIWLDNNATTNTRQLSQFYDTLSDLHAKGKSDIIAGVMVGNEVLFRADMTETQLISTINDVRSNLSANGFENLPAGTSELGSQWSADLAEAVDMVGANVHPFFAGVTADVAASWTWKYWQDNDVSITSSSSSSSTKNKTQIIAETGWPTTGGYYLGSTSGISQLNTFMADWVCDSLTNGTMYWWFEAFDEGWKRLLDSNSTTDGMVESHWGLFEEGSWALKEGVVVPGCGGRSAGMVF